MVYRENTQINDIFFERIYKNLNFLIIDRIFHVMNPVIFRLISHFTPHSVRCPDKCKTDVTLGSGTVEEEHDFLEEIRSMKFLGQHPNILNFLACCTTGSPKFLVVEFAVGGDLLSYLRQRRQQVSLFCFYIPVFILVCYMDNITLYYSC